MSLPEHSPPQLRRNPRLWLALGGGTWWNSLMRHRHNSQLSYWAGWLLRSQHGVCIAFAHKREVLLPLCLAEFLLLL